MIIRTLFLTAILLTGAAVANAANAETEQPRKPKFKYTSSGSFGMSFFPLIGLEKLPVDSASAILHQPLALATEQIDSLISCPVAF